jgi:VIT1/CCC1 family predicted Fe2+/Mn2+ transporter
MISGMTSSALLCPNYRVRLLLKRERQLLFASSSSSSSFFYVFFSVLPGVFVFFFFPSYFWCVRLVASWPFHF